MMAEFYNNGVTIVTSEKLIHGNKTVPLNMISDQVNFKMPFEFGGLIINGAGVLLGLWLISFLNGWSLLGLAIVALCGFNVKNILTVETHILSIDLHNGDNFELKGKSGQAINEISAALKAARMS